MRKCVGGLVSFLLSLQLTGQSLGTQYLKPHKADHVDTSHWVLYRPLDLSAEDVIIRTLANGWVIGKPGDIRDNDEVFQINNEWKWPSKVRNLAVALQHKEASYVLSFTELPSNLPEEAQVIPEQQAILLRTSKAAIEQDWLTDTRLVWIDFHSAPAEESILRRHDLSVNDVYNAHHHFGRAYGVPTSIKEQRFRLEDLDIAGISDTTARSFPGISSHATDMATLVSGKGVSFLYGTGVSNGPLISTSFDLLFPEPSSYFEEYQCEVQNHSFGVGVENYYGAEARSYDEFAQQSPEVLHVFSSGNSGEFTALEGKYTGLLQTANLTGTFKQAKNVLVVGATDSPHNVKSYSSVGPTYDGRIKPELVAYGGEGSSDAAAVVSGMASYLKGYAHTHKNKSLSAQETKALLIAGAKDLGAPGPDYSSGFGSASLIGSLELLRKDQFYTDTLRNLTASHDLSLATGVHSLKIVLYWNDSPASLDANEALVHDLNLTLRTPDGTIIQPWTLSSFPNRDSLSLPAKRSRDQLNNVEMISLEDASPGTYTVSVSVDSNLDLELPYTIAYQMESIDLFEWKYPMSSDHLLAGEPMVVRWKSTLDAGTNGRLLWQWTDHSSLVLSEQVNVDAEQAAVMMPDSLGKGKLVLDYDGVTYFSDTLWTESVPEVDLLLNCDNRLILQWPSSPLINETRLFDPELLNSNAALTDSSLSIEPDLLNAPFLAIRHRYEEKLGIRSYAINYQQQGVGCYLSSFIPRISDENSVLLEIVLNAVDLIDEVVVEKMGPKGSSTPFTINEPSSSLVLEDTDLQTGIYDYRVVVTLKDGNTITSDFQTVYFANQASSLVFPNPVSPSAELAVMSDAIGGVFQLVDLQGKLSMQWDITNSIEYIPLTLIRQGLYSYRIVSEGNILQQGKIVVK